MYASLTWQTEGILVEVFWEDREHKKSIFSDAQTIIALFIRMPDYINHWDSYFGEGQAPWIGCDKYGIMPYKLRICEGISYIGTNALKVLVA